MRILISACLLGVNCRYDGGNNGVDCGKDVKRAEGKDSQEGGRDSRCGSEDSQRGGERDGAGCEPAPWLRRLLAEHTVIPVCPEQLGGLPTPRPPVEWRDGRAVNVRGQDCTEEFERGAEAAARLARLYGCELAILKARSPSCGSSGIYDGTFSHHLVDGMGAAAKRLREQGVRVIDEEEAARCV